MEPLGQQDKKKKKCKPQDERGKGGRGWGDEEKPRKSRFLPKGSAGLRSFQKCSFYLNQVEDTSQARITQPHKVPKETCDSRTSSTAGRFTLFPVSESPIFGKKLESPPTVPPRRDFESYSRACPVGAGRVFIHSLRPPPPLPLSS